MTDKTKVTAMDLLGIMPNTYPDIPSEYLIGLDRGRLGDWLQEVADDGWEVDISPPANRSGGEVEIWRGDDEYYGRDDDTHRVDVMILRAYLAWKEREG